METLVEFQRRPSAVAYMTRALRPRPRWDAAAGLPSLRLVWHQARVDARQFAQFRVLAGLPAADSLPLLWPHVVGFRLSLALLTHPAWPLPLWRALQVRNRIVQHARLPPAASFEFTTRVAAHRVLDKGLEVDLHSSALADGTPAWEGTTTFWWRGRFGPAGPAAPARAPEVAGEELARWRTTAGVGLPLARLTGDYNGLHLWAPYARRLGFPGAFHHPQLLLAQCLARLRAGWSGQPQRLDAWLKGPVCYGAQVVLRAQAQGGAIEFALHADDDPRAAIVGRWSPRAAG